MLGKSTNRARAAWRTLKKSSETARSILQLVRSCLPRSSNGWPFRVLNQEVRPSQFIPRGPALSRLVRLHPALSGQNFKTAHYPERAEVRQKYCYGPVSFRTKKMPSPREPWASIRRRGGQSEHIGFSVERKPPHRRRHFPFSFINRGRGPRLIARRRRR